MLKRRSIQGILQTQLGDILQLGPFNSNLQRRWRKPINNAQTRLENRTRDLKLDKLMYQLRKLNQILDVNEFISNQRNNFSSLQLLSKHRNHFGINIQIGAFLAKYPHIFEIYTQPVRKNLCCKISEKMRDLIENENQVIRANEPSLVERLKKLLMISTNGTLNMHALWLIRKELGLRDDFRQVILPKYPRDFALLNPETLILVSRDENLAKEQVDKWREKEFREKWLSETETKFAFPINFPTGFEIQREFKQKMGNWQRLEFTKPYENKEGGIRSKNIDRFEKRAVGILHEFLSLMVERMIPFERLSHFRREYSMDVNVRELILKHPGIFYISTKGQNQMVFLRDAYFKGCLVESNPVYEARRKMLDLVILGRRDTKEMEMSSVGRNGEDWDGDAEEDSSEMEEDSYEHNTF